MKPIYVPRGAAKEYGDLALNIFLGCSHSCSYCYCPTFLKRSKEDFFQPTESRSGIVDATVKQLEKDRITGKTIHLCFIGDPYQTGVDTSVTREIIQALKTHGNHVQILTKGSGRRDFDLLDGNDRYGITVSCLGENAKRAEPGAIPPEERISNLIEAKTSGIGTWVSFEPVINAVDVLMTIERYHEFFDRVKIGKLNYYKSDVDWKWFGFKAEELCKSLGLEYYIKDSLRAEMNK